MPKFKNKGVKGKWNTESMKAAIDQVLSKKMSTRVAAKAFDVPRTTLRDKVNKLQAGHETVIKPDMGRFKPTFAKEYEMLLVDHIKSLENRLMPLSKNEFGRLAFDLAEALKINHRFNRETKTAGKNFYYDFLQRQPELSLRTAESTSIQRASGFNKPQVDRFFHQLNDLMTKHSFIPSKIFNADETGVSRVHENKLKVLAAKGKKQVGKLTSGERGRTVTILLCVNASGDQFIPPLFIFPRKKMNDRLKIGAPEGSMFAAQDNGWINGPIFIKWFEEFIKRTHPTKDEPVLLIVDGHSSHKELKVIEMARANNVHILSLPPHSTHKMQPLDRAIMKPFKDAYNEQCGLWMRKNPFQRITEFEIAGIVNNAFTKICRMDLAKSGFECSGIHPFNPNIFTDIDYLGAKGLDLEIPSTENETLRSPEALLPLAELTLPNKNNKEHLEPQPGTSRSITPLHSPEPLSSSPELTLKSKFNKLDAKQVATSKSIKELLETQPEPYRTVAPSPTQEVSTVTLSPQQNKFIKVLNEISPLPVAKEKRLNARKRRAGRSEILTSTPVKDEMEEKQKNRTIDKRVKEQKRRVNFDSIGQENLSSKKGKAKKSTKSEGDKNIDKVNCNICGENFDEPWIRCDYCSEWSHEACANLEAHPVYYKCDNCT